MLYCIHYYKDAMLASLGYVAQVDEDLCAACGNCADYCQFEAIVVDYDACTGCGVCVSKCSQDAISLLRDPARGDPLEIRKLMARAAEMAKGSESNALQPDCPL